MRLYNMFQNHVILPLRTCLFGELEKRLYFFHVWKSRLGGGRNNSCPLWRIKLVSDASYQFHIVEYKGFIRTE